MFYTPMIKKISFFLSIKYEFIILLKEYFLYYSSVISNEFITLILFFKHQAYPTIILKQKPSTSQDKNV